MAISTQDIKKQLDLTAQVTVDASQLNQLVDTAITGDDRGLVVKSEDTALDTPDVPNADTVTKFKRFIWMRVPHATSPNTEPILYYWHDGMASSDATFLKWIQISGGGSDVDLSSYLSNNPLLVGNTRFEDETLWGSFSRSRDSLPVGELVTKQPQVNVLAFMTAATGYASNDDIRNGVTDARPAIQAAIDYLQTIGGGVLFFPSGTYRMGRNPTLGPTANNSSVGTNYSVLVGGGGKTYPITLCGNGNTSIIKQDDVYTVCFYYNLYSTTYHQGFRFENIKFKGNTQDGIYLDQTKCLGAGVPYGGNGALLYIESKGTATEMDKASNIVFKHCTFEDMDKTFGVHLNYLNDISFIGCSFYQFKDLYDVDSSTIPGMVPLGLPTVYGHFCNELRFVGCYFNGSVNNPTATTPDGCDGMVWMHNGRSIVVTGCTIVNYNFEAIQFNGQYASCCNNLFITTRTLSTGAFQYTYEYAYYGFSVGKITMSGNVMYGGSYLFQNFVPIVQVNSPQFDLIAFGNLCRFDPASTPIAIGVFHGRYCNISGNIFENCVPNFINIVGAPLNSGNPAMGKINRESFALVTNNIFAKQKPDYNERSVNVWNFHDIQISDNVIWAMSKHIECYITFTPLGDERIYLKRNIWKDENGLDKPADNVFVGYVQDGDIGKENYVFDTPGYPATKAVLTPTVSLGQLTSISIDTAGSGYTTETAKVTIKPNDLDYPNATPAQVDLTVTGGTITGYTIINPGSGMTNTPLCRVSTPRPFYHFSDKFINNMRNDFRTPISWHYVGNGAFLPQFTAGMGMLVQGEIDLTQADVAVNILSGMNRLYHRVLDCGFVMLGNISASGGTANRLLLKTNSAGSTPRISS